MKSGDLFDEEVIDRFSLPRSASPHPKALGRFAIARFFERLAFFSMRHWLIIFLTVKAQGNDVNTFYSYYHWVLAALAFAPVPGGLFVDLIYSRRKAVVYGGALLATGYFVLAIDHPVSTVLGFIFAMLGMGLYSGSSLTSLGSYYRGREEYTTAGMYHYFGLVNLAAFLSSIFIGMAASIFNWQQGCMLAGILMMLGHVYLLVVHKTFQEERLPETLQTDPEPATSSKRNTLVPVGLILLAFLFFGFALQNSHNGLGKLSIAISGLRDWSNLSAMITLLLLTLALFAGSAYFTQVPRKGYQLLGFGLLASAVGGFILPGVIGLGVPTVPTVGVVALTAFQIVMMVLMEFLVVAPVFALILKHKSRYSNTLIGLLSLAAYLPFSLVLLPAKMGDGATGTYLLPLISVGALALLGMWMLKEGKK